MFKISPAPLDLAVLSKTLLAPEAGACVTFEGWVRNRNEGQAVQSLEYEAYVVLAEKEGAKILEEARQQYELLAAACVHRTGHLRIGDAAVWVGVAAEHRGPAFEACRFIIDEAKARLAMLGLVAKVQPVTINGKTWNRILLGPYADASATEAAKKALADNGVKAIPISRRPGE